MLYDYYTCRGILFIHLMNIELLEDFYEILIVRYI